MTVSVIVPCLKRDEATERCLAEIRRQAASGGAELDLVVVEGVSPYARAVNEGLRRSVGDYIAWVDADDEVLEGWWQAICHAVESRPDVVVMGWRDEQSSADLAWMPSSGNAARNLLRSVLRDDAPCSFLWNKAMRKELWEGERFDECWRFQADFSLLPRVLQKARTVVAIDRPLYWYHFNSESISRKETPMHWKELLDVRWRRFEDWRRTDYAAEALAPFVTTASWRYATAVSEGLRLNADALLDEQRRRLRGCLLTVWRTRADWRCRLRAILFVLGWTWPQRLSFWIHGVK